MIYINCFDVGSKTMNLVFNCSFNPGYYTLLTLEKFFIQKFVLPDFEGSDQLCLFSKAHA